MNYSPTTLVVVYVMIGIGLLVVGTILSQIFRQRIDTDPEVALLLRSCLSLLLTLITCITLFLFVPLSKNSTPLAWTLADWYR